jgi:uncharacterized protein (UPF0332 family)
MKTEDLFKERLLRKIIPSPEKIKSSLKIAENKLEESKKLFESMFFNQAVITAYTCMFHSARALLYNEGIQEKSHFALCVYLKENYPDKISKNLLNSFDNYRKERHEALYGFDYEAGKEDAESAIEDSEELLNKLKEILNAKL